MTGTLFRCASSAQGVLATLTHQLGVDSDGHYGKLVDQDTHQLAKTRSDKAPEDTE